MFSPQKDIHFLLLILQFLYLNFKLNYIWVCYAQVDKKIIIIMLPRVIINKAILNIMFIILKIKQ